MDVATRVFYRVVVSPSPETIATAIDAVVNDVNTFLASLPSLDRALGVEYRFSDLKSSSNHAWVVYTGTVAFVQES